MIIYKGKGWIYISDIHPLDILKLIMCKSPDIEKNQTWKRSSKVVMIYFSNVINIVIVVRKVLEFLVRIGTSSLNEREKLAWEK